MVRQRVIHVIDSMRIDRGGTVTVVTELARRQALMGSSVLVSTNLDSLPCDDRAAAEHRWKGLDVRWLGDRGESLRSALRSTAAETIVHAHGVWDLSSLRSCFLARRVGAPWVISTHGMLHPRALARHRWRKRVVLGLAGSVVRQPSRLLVLNAAEAAEVLRLTGAAPQVVPNGVDADQFGSSDGGSALRSLCPALRERRYLLFVGRIHEIKGTEALVRAFAHARGQGAVADLVLAGPDQGGLESTRAAARRAGVGGHVHFAGRVAGPVRASAYSGCVAFAHRPVYEGFGLAVIEALSAGRPAVITRRCELDGGGAGDFLRWADDTDSAFGQALAEFVANSPAAPVLPAKEWVRQKYSWEAVERQILVAYERARSSPIAR